MINGVKTNAVIVLINTSLSKNKKKRCVRSCAWSHEAFKAPSGNGRVCGICDLCSFRFRASTYSIMTIRVLKNMCVFCVEVESKDSILFGPSFCFFGRPCEAS